MALFTLSSVAYFNPYFLGNTEVKSFVIYDETGPIKTIKRGWFTSNQSYNRENIPALNELELRRARVENFKKRDHFFISKGGHTTVYLYAPEVGFKDLGERETHRNEKSIHYGNFYELFDVELTEFGRVEETNFGKRLQAIGQVLKEAQIDLSIYEIERLVNVYPSILSEQK